MKEPVTTTESPKFWNRVKAIGFMSYMLSLSITFLSLIGFCATEHHGWLWGVMGGFIGGISTVLIGLFIYGIRVIIKGESIL